MYGILRYLKELLDDYGNELILTHRVCLRNEFSINYIFPFSKISCCQLFNFKSMPI